MTLAAQVILAPGNIIARHYEDNIAVPTGEIIHRRQVVTYRCGPRLQLLPKIIYVIGSTHVYTDVSWRGQVELLRHAFQYFLRVDPQTRLKREFPPYIIQPDQYQGPISRMSNTREYIYLSFLFTNLYTKQELNLFHSIDN